jgi:lysyl-tRNA synthetase class 2
MSPASKLAILRDRAAMFSKVRAFFAERHVMEVDVPIMGKGAPIDAHIDVMAIPLQGGERGFLHTSPEYAMKRLLSYGAGDIFQMSHVFRDGELGHLHNPEFTMVEWYRIGKTFPELIDETTTFIRLFLGDIPVHFLTYRAAFKQYAGIDSATASPQDLIACAHDHALHLPADAHHWDKDTLLNFLMGFLIEKKLQELTVLQHYPATQSALARTTVKEGETVAERFEIYYKGIELANGFHELTDPIEQRRRFHEENAARLRLGKEQLPLDENFLQALEKGLPDCCGVAVGFDRLMLLRHNKHHLSDVLPFSWHSA